MAGEVRQYADAMKAPLDRLSRWTGAIVQFTGDARAGDLAQVACASGRLDALIAEGDAVAADLRAVQPPQAIASTHARRGDSVGNAVATLREAHTRVCEQGNVAAAERVLDEVGVGLDGLGELLGKLRGLIGQR